MLLLGLSLLAVLVVPAATGRVVTGVPQAVPVPGPPTVGQCVGQKFDPAWDMVGAEASRYRYPELTVGECSQPHYGEVVALITQPVNPKIDVDPGSSGYSVEDTNMDACYTAAGRYLGTNGAPAGSAEMFGYWSVDVFPTAVALTPTTRQRAAGQQWLACATYLFDLSEIGQRSLVGYHGSLRSAETTGVGRDHRGVCPAEVDWNEVTSLRCGRAHHGEIFGFGTLLQAATRTTLTSSCAKLVSQVTKRDGLERDGRLTIAVQATDMDGTAATGATLPKGSSVECGVLTTGHRLLKGSLIAIGSEPIPWA